MARGNWQRRVELNETRRNEAKQKKQRNEEKKLWKVQAQAFLTMLDKNMSTIMNTHRQRRRQKQHNQKQLPQRKVGQMQSSMSSSSGILHIYTDTLPSDSPPVLDLWEDDQHHHQVAGGNNRRARARSISIENEKAVTSNSGSGKKKVHPRSKESYNNNKSSSTSDANQGAVDDDGGGGDSSMFVVAPKMCSSYFFRGNCANGKKGAGGGKRSTECRYIHYPKRYMSLYDVLASSSNGGESLSTSETSYAVNVSRNISNDLAVANDDDLIHKTDGSMDMIYYFSMNLDDFDESFIDKDGIRTTTTTNLLSVWVTEALTTRNCNLGSLVYVTLDDTLLFDRYRQGTVVQEDDFILRRTNRTAAAKDHDSCTPSGREDIAKALPASVLEYCLLFLEDPAVATMSSVCKAWNHEIGKQSGDLWKNLLKRRKWPLPLSVTQPRTENVDSLTAIEEAQQLRSEFISHYKSIRACRAIRHGIGLLTSGRKNLTVGNADFCTRSFETVENAPQEGNYCVSLKIFSPNRFLAAYRTDCTLRLFDSAGKLCRELLCYCIDPYRNTKKRECKIVAMSLDETCVGSLLQVTDDGTGAEASLLAVVSREALLIADDSVDNDSTQIIDINQSVLNYLLSCEEADHGLLQLVDFISDGGDLDEVEVLVSRCLESCGYGRFLVEVTVSVPLGDATDDDDSDAAMTMLFRKLFLLSSTMGAIIWMCDSNASTRPIRPRHDDMTLATMTLQENGRWGSRILSVSAHCPGIMSGSVNPSGDFIDPILIETSQSLRVIDEQGGWNLRGARLRAVVIVGHIIVMADNLFRTEDEITTFKSVLRFYSFENGTAAIADPTSMTLDENIVIHNLIRLDEMHVMAIGIETVPTTPVEDDGLDGIDGHWFGNRDETNGGRQESQVKVNIVSIIIDVKSRSEIFRTVFADYTQIAAGGYSGDFFNEGDVPLLIAAHGDTVAAGVWWKGVVSTGEDTRGESVAVRNTPNETPNNKSKKKKKGLKKAGKKDGFARGMSLRG